MILNSLMSANHLIRGLQFSKHWVSHRLRDLSISSIGTNLSIQRGKHHDTRAPNNSVFHTVPDYTCSKIRKCPITLLDPNDDDYYLSTELIRALVVATRQIVIPSTEQLIVNPNRGCTDAIQTEIVGVSGSHAPRL